ncbi:MAG: tRNA (N6-isopentenyl adenosine(37)-C2)-methylthiotransferase MiaB [Thermodesulfobacteriota bacterium]
MTDSLREKKVFIATFGCQMNEYDSDVVFRLLSERGWSRTREIGQADFIFLNTCSIREKAEQKVYSYLGRLRPLKEARPDLVIGVGGCVAQQEGEKLLEAAPFVDLVLGTHGVRRLPDLLEEAARTRQAVCYTGFDYETGRTPVPVPEGAGLKAFLTIMQGCDNFCAYCVVPYVRGREISRPPGDILAEAGGLLAGGVKEITLLGQNVNSYGRGLEPAADFVDLLERMAGLPGLLRLRFTTSHPKDLSPRLMRAMAEIGPLCEHLHLPVQAGSSAVLSAMGRGYSREEYLARVEALREARPGVALTTDVIVGFPGETEADFQETMSLVEQVRFDGMFSFKYSDRPNTRAAGLPGKVDEAVKGRRLSELQARQKEISASRNREMVGRRVEVLVEGRSGRYDGQLTGRTRGNKIVNFTGPSGLIGGLAEPLVVEAWANSLRGILPEAENAAGAAPLTSRAAADS